MEYVEKLDRLGRDENSALGRIRIFADVRLTITPGSPESKIRVQSSMVRARLCGLTIFFTNTVNTWVQSKAKQHQARIASFLPAVAPTVANAMSGDRPHAGCRHQNVRSN
jgi:hypothetical protein